MDSRVITIKNNIERISERIALAASSCGRDYNQIKLVIVTKMQPVEVIEAAIQAGACDLGENYPEEAKTKIISLAKYQNVKWHMIGHLQSRKIRIIVDHFQTLHSLDSLSLAEKLSRALGEHGKILPVLLEFNLSGELTKSGWPAWDDASWEAAIPDIEKIIGMPAIKIEGLMTMPPLFLDPTQTRPYFFRLRKLQDYLNKKFPLTSWEHLSMGTSGDFETAIQEGATIVRLGQAILGSRPPKPLK